MSASISHTKFPCIAGSSQNDHPSIIDQSFDILHDLPDRHAHCIKRALESLKNPKYNLNKQIYTWLLTHTTHHLCREIDFSMRKISILILGHVQSDGLGDYFHMIHAAETIQKAFPNATITLGMEVQDLNKREGHFPLSPFESIFWGVNWRSNSKVTYDNESKDVDIEKRKKCKAVAKNATLILDLPHSNYSAYIGKPVLAPRIRIVEYGAVADNKYLCIGRGKSIGMGLSPFEQGLIRKNVDVGESTITELRDAALKSLLLHDISEDLELTIDYQQNHSLHFGYGVSNKITFVETCLIYDKNDRKPYVDIIGKFELNDLDYYTSIATERAGFSEVKEIELWQKQADGTMEKISKTIQGSGKTLRLICPFPLPNEDMQRLISLSSGPLGCTGDLSFSEVISREGIPYYTIEKHKIKFYKSVINLAEQIFDPSTSPLVMYLKTLNTHNANPQILAELLHDTRTKEEMKRFCDHLKRYYNFNEVLIDIVSGVLVKEFYPNMRELESTLIDAYANNEKTLKQCYDEFQYEVQHNTLS